MKRRFITKFTTIFVCVSIVAGSFRTYPTVHTHHSYYRNRRWLVSMRENVPLSSHDRHHGTRLIRLMFLVFTTT